MRLTIKKHNQQIIRELAEKLGTDDAEALNYLLLSLKAQNLGIPQQTLTPPSIPLGFEVSPIVSNPTPMEFIEPIVENDPIIQRFVELGLDQF